MKKIVQFNVYVVIMVHIIWFFFDYTFFQTSTIYKKHVSRKWEMRAWTSFEYGSFVLKPHAQLINIYIISHLISLIQALNYYGMSIWNFVVQYFIRLLYLSKRRVIFRTNQKDFLHVKFFLNKGIIVSPIYQHLCYAKSLSGPNMLYSTTRLCYLVIYKNKYIRNIHQFQLTCIFLLMFLRNLLDICFLF